MFDAAAKIMGGPLQQVRATLMIWSKMAPEEGSYGKTLAIMANEVAKAAKKNGRRLR